jgi:ATP-binding cassette, subfamily B, bacterial PglK
MENFKKLWSLLSRRRHKQFYLILSLMIFSSLTEVVSIGAVFPLLGVFSAPDIVYQHSIMQPIIQILGITKPEQLLLPVTVFFIIAVLISTSIRLVLLYVITRFSYATGADLSIDIYRRTLYQEYSKHLLLNSSDLINSIISKTTGVIKGVITPILTIISSAFLIVLIMVILFTINFSVAITTSIGLGLIYLGIVRITGHKLKENSKCIAKESTKMIKALQEGLGGIRDVLLNGSQEFYCDMYRDADTPLRKASGDNIFIVSSPRYIIESIGMILIAFFAYNLGSQEDKMNLVIPILGSFALGAQRLMPALQQVYNAYGTIKGGYASFEDVLKLLDQPIPSYIKTQSFSPMIFKEAIKIQNISFRYTKEDAWIFRNINLRVMTT